MFALKTKLDNFFFIHFAKWIQPLLVMPFTETRKCVQSIVKTLYRVRDYCSKNSSFLFKHCVKKKLCENKKSKSFSFRFFIIFLGTILLILIIDFSDKIAAGFFCIQLFFSNKKAIKIWGTIVLTNICQCKYVYIIHTFMYFHYWTDKSNYSDKLTSILN